MDYEFGILGELALSEDEHPLQIAVQAYEVELERQKKISFAEWENDSADYVKSFLGNIVCELQPNEHDYAVRLEVISRLSKLLDSSDALRGATIAAFGSFESNLYTEWADLDLSLQFPKESKISETIGQSWKAKILRSFMRILWKKGQRVLFIPYARVPLLTFEDPRYHISCDISVDNGVATFKSWLLRWICHMDSRCRDLIFLVKCWAKSHGINDPKTGTLNSFTLCLLVIFHLQTRSPPVLPPLNAVLHEDIARTFSERSSQMSRDELQDTCLEKVQSFITKKYGIQNKSSVAELFVSFFCQFSSVSRLWLEGLAVCTFTGTWGDTASTSRQWKSKHHAMAVEDPFDCSENCARSVQEKSLSRIINSFASTVKAFEHTSSHLDLHSLPEILFCFPAGSQKHEIRIWLSKLYSKEGKVAGVQLFKQSFAASGSSTEVASCQNHRPMQTANAAPQKNSIVQDREINIIDQCKIKQNMARSSAEPYNSSQDQDREQKGTSKMNPHQMIQNRKIRELQVGGKVMQPTFSDTHLLGGVNKASKGYLQYDKTVCSDEFVLQEGTSGTMRRRMLNESFPQYTPESSAGQCCSEFPKTNRAGTEITVEMLKGQQDKEAGKSDWSSRNKVLSRRSIFRRQGTASQTALAPPLSAMHIAETSYQNDKQTATGEGSNRQRNSSRLLYKTSNDLCNENNTKTFASVRPETKEESISSVQKGRVSNNSKQLSVEADSRGYWKATIQKRQEKPAEQLSRAKKWMEDRDYSGERKLLGNDNEHSVHTLTGSSGHPSLAESLNSMQVFDLEGGQNFERKKENKKKYSRKQLWRPKFQE